MGAPVGFAEDTVRLAAALRPALATRGVPESIYVDNGSAFVDSWLLRAAGIDVVKIPPRAPRANAYAERWVGTVRSECLDWTLIWNQQQLRRVLTEYLRHYNRARPHRSLNLQPPNPADPAGRLTLVDSSSTVERPVRRVDVLGGLIHEYQRAA